MSESPDKDIEALEFLIDTQEHDLGMYNKKLKELFGTADQAKIAADTARKNFLYLKREAVVVKMSEYTIAKNALARSEERMKEIQEEIKQVRKMISTTESDIKFSRKTLNSLQSKVELHKTPTAKILEFKLNDSGRDPT